ncbi:MAG: flagellar export chaperone FliS [Candidatus Melainabacteria bacterium]
MPPLPSPYQNQARQYQRQAIETASPEEILLMLYDGAIRFLVIARKAMDANDLETVHKNLIKTQDILVEFMTSLDMDIGGEVAVNLFKLYEYLHHQLVQANIKKDPARVDEVLEHLRKLKDTWEQAIDIAAREAREAGSSPGGAAGETSVAREFSA